MIEPEEEITEALRLARKAIVDRMMQWLWRLADKSHSATILKGAAFIRRALQLNPNFASAWSFLGFTQLYRGEPEEAIEHQIRALRLNPLDPRHGFMEACIAYGHFMVGRYDEAASWARGAIRDQPHFLAGHRVAAASNALADRMEEARAAIAALREADPTFRISNLWSRIPLRRPEDRARLEEGLRKAGLPE